MKAPELTGLTIGYLRVSRALRNVSVPLPATQGMQEPCPRLNLPRSLAQAPKPVPTEGPEPVGHQARQVPAASDQTCAPGTRRSGNHVTHEASAVSEVTDGDGHSCARSEGPLLASY